MGKGSHDPQADEPAKLAARTLTMKRSASRDLLGDALDCAASCIDAAALDAYRLDYASSASGVRYPDTSFPFVLAAVAPSRRRRRAAGHGEPQKRQISAKAHIHTPLPARLRSRVGRDPKKNAGKSSHTRAAHAVAAPPANRKKNAKKNAGIDWERCAARRANSRRPTTTRPP
jgi:hypothetical protein